MKLFENKVGRPSNELLKRRKNAKILIIACVVAVLCLVSYGIYSLTSVTGIAKNIKATDAAFSISGVNGGFVYKSKYYAKGKKLALGGTSKANPLGVNVLFFSSSGNTSFNIVGNFGKKMTVPPDKKPIAFSIQGFDTNNKVVSSSNVLVKSSTHTLKMTASKNIRYVKITLSKTGEIIYSTVVNISNLPTIEHKKVTAAAKNSSGEFVQKESGEAKMKFTVTNYSGHTLYYRWFTYKNNVVKSSEVGSKNQTCVAFNKTTTTAEYPLSVTRPRAATLRVYATLNDCRNDNSAKYPRPSTSNRTVLSDIIVRYKLMYTTTNSSGFTVLSSFNKATIGKLIGSQTKSDCKQYAYKYAYYMKHGTTTTGYSPICSTYSNRQSLLNIIKKNIDSGNPIMVFFSNNYGTYKQHWGVAVGYKLNNNGELNNLGQIYFLDPYSSAGYGKKGENVLWAGTAFNSNNVSTHGTMKALKNNTYCYSN